MLKTLNKTIFSFGFVMVLLCLMALGAAVATFIENDYGAQTAKFVVYSATWYEVIMITLGISMAGIIYRFKMWKKPGAFLFHFGFIVVLLGAGLTRYIGYEGIMHIREGDTVNKMISAEPYFQITSEKEHQYFQLNLGAIGNNHFSYDTTIGEKPLNVTYKGYLPPQNRNSNLSTLLVDVTYDGETKEAKIGGGYGMRGYDTDIIFKDKKITVTWGSKVITLPFGIKLIDFQLERYPGSMAPSSYASEVLLIDKEKNIEMPFRIYMNHTLDHRSYKFFQSSYDQDEQGTVLTVNNDPGKWPTYFGYFLLTIGFLLNFFGKGSRYLYLQQFLKKSNLSFLIPLLFLGSSLDLKADLVKEIQDYQKTSFEHSVKFGELLIQDSSGRIKPINSLSRDILNKISGKTSLYGLTSEQIVLGMMTNAKTWQQVKMIKVSTPMAKILLKMKPDEKYISFVEAFNEDGYILGKHVNSANRKPPSKRDKLDRDIISIDERLNVAYMTYSGSLMKFIPIPNDPNNKWVDPQTAVKSDWIDKLTGQIIMGYIQAVNVGITEGAWDKADLFLNALKKAQEVHGKNIVPNDLRIKMEVLFNEFGIFPKLVPLYVLLGIFMLAYALISVFTKQEKPVINKIFISLLTFAFVIHTVGMGMRWYVSGHAPWSDTYESLVYIGWSAAFAGIIFFRKSMLALASTSVLAGIFMFVAHLSFISPQITTLVPVLKSYWLTIHVSIITASYGFLGLGAILGLLAMTLMIFRNQQREHLDLQIRKITAINEISLIIGLAMLTIGNFLGGVWANESWGRYWGWDPKETWAFISIVVYVIVTHLRFIPGFNTIYTFAFASTVAFSSILMTYFGVNFYLSGLHSYATGDPVPIPTFVYFLLLIVGVISLLAYRKRDVPRL